MEISELIRILMQKKNERQIQLVLATQDVQKAFDHLDHNILQHAMANKNIPERLQYAVFQESAGLCLIISLNGVKTTNDSK